MTDVAKMENAAAFTVTDPMVAMIERVAMDPNLPVDRLSALMDMRERQMDKEAEQSFNQSFAEAMGEMPDIPKSGENKHLRTRYSTLDDLIRTTRPVLARHGLSLNWQNVASDGNVSIMAIVRHAMGHSINTSLAGARDTGKQMNNLQGGGSTETYLKRYTGFSILGLSSGDERDDDGNNPRAIETISADQFLELRDQVEQADADAAMVCKAHNAPSLEQFPARDFKRAMAQLQRRIDAKRNAR